MKNAYLPNYSSKRSRAASRISGASRTLPQPLESEGELTVGHIGRVRKWCGISGTLKKTTIVIQQSVSNHLGVPMSWPSAIAHGCGIDAHDYVAKHSMLPFNECVDNVNQPERVHAYGWPEAFHSNLLAAPMNQAVFCRRCVEEQLEERPFAVWRRLDHLPYRFRCAVHDVPLLRAHDSEAHTEDPAAILESGAWSAVPAQAEWLESAAVQRLDSTSEALLRSGVRWPRHRVWSRLRQRAGMRNITGSEKACGELLSDAICKAFPDSFLTDKFPSFRKKVPGRRIASVDGVISGRYQALSPYLSLAIAVLYRSGRSALNDFSTPD